MFIRLSICATHISTLGSTQSPDQLGVDCNAQLIVNIVRLVAPELGQKANWGGWREDTVI